MRSGFFIIYLIFLALASEAQTQLSGKLADAGDGEGIPFAHVVNRSNSMLTVTSQNGEFQIEAGVGDTVQFSMVSYQSLGWVMKPHHFEKPYLFELHKDTVLLDAVTVFRLPPEHIFKQRVIDAEVPDTGFWYHGVAEPVPYGGDPTLNEKVIRNPLFVASHPLTALYYNFSKQEKERRKHHRATQLAPIQKRVYDKVTRQWITDSTGLSGDELTGFIAYCNYSLKYLDETPLYMIYEDMKLKLENYLAQK